MNEKFAELKKKGSFAFSANEEPKCPHCGEVFDIQEGEAWFIYDEQNTHELECPDCNQVFQVNSHARWCFSTDDQEIDQ